MSGEKYILVSGGAGFIGSHTVVELTKAGYKAIIADDFRNANRIVVAGITDILQETPEIYEIDVCDKKSLEKLFQTYTFSGIIHFAADKAVGESVANPLKYYHNNIGGLVSMCELALKYKVNNFVFSSSCTVYGEPLGQKEVNEATPKAIPNSPYGNTKLIGEQILQDVQRVNKDFKVINLRYFNPVGAHPSGLIGEFPFGKPSNLIPFITQTAIGKHEFLTVFGNNYSTIDGSCVRDYIHICDLASAHVKALSFLEMKKDDCIEAVNIGTGKGTSVLQIITAFERLSGEKLNWKFGDRRSGDVSEIYANTTKSKSMLNWEPHYSVEDAILHAWNWEKNLQKNA
jgi:UDP-glucose 4-epimerase